MNIRKKTLDEICDKMDFIHEAEIHDMAEIELCKIVSTILESGRNLCNAAKNWLFELIKGILSETPYDMSYGNGQLLPIGLLPDSDKGLKSIAQNLNIYIRKTLEFKRLLIDSGLTLQERTVVVLRYIHNKSEYESDIITEYEDTEAILWTALIKIGHTLLHNPKN
jgi:hypothetical protein